MAEVTVTVTPYPGATTGLQLEEWSPIARDWADASDITQVGTSTRWTATVTNAANLIRARWVLAAGGHSRWFPPDNVVEKREPTEGQEAQLKEAIIAKATRIYLQTAAALGHVGQITEFGVATVRPDYQIRELLMGLRWVEWDVDTATLVTTDDVITQGLQAEANDTWPDEKITLLEEAIAAAWSWVTTDILEGIPV